MIKEIDQRLREITQGIARSYNAKVDLQLNQGGYWPVENNHQITAE